MGSSLPRLGAGLGKAMPVAEHALGGWHSLFPQGIQSYHGHVFIPEVLPSAQIRFWGGTLNASELRLP